MGGRWGSMSASMRLGVISLFLVVGTTGNAANENLFELHRNAGSLSSKECLACHAGIMKQGTLDEKVKTFHRLHLESKKDTPKECSDCHRSVDLKEGSAEAFRKQVDPSVCLGCHDGSIKDAKVLFAK